MSVGFPAALRGSARRWLPGIFLVSGLLPSWMGLAGGLHWSLDLLSHFRWQYLLFGLAAIAWAWWRRQHGMLVLALLTTLLNAGLIAGLARAPHVIRDVPLAEGAPLRVLTFNVWQHNPRKEDVLEYIRRVDADILFLAEVDGRWARSLAQLADLYPHRIVRLRPRDAGVAVLSRLPLEDQAPALPQTRRTLPWVMAHVTHQGRQLLFIGTHPPSPIDGNRAWSRDRQFAIIAEYVEASSMPALVVGDFNATPWSAHVRQLYRSGLAFRGPGPPWTPTWKVHTPLAITIDHALCTEPLVITRRKVGPALGSDHRPVEIEVRWADAADGR